MGITKDNCFNTVDLAHATGASYDDACQKLCKEVENNPNLKHAFHILKKSHK